jgi:hypothetical protein
LGETAKQKKTLETVIKFKGVRVSSTSRDSHTYTRLFYIEVSAKEGAPYSYVIEEVRHKIVRDISNKLIKKFGENVFKSNHS